MGYYSFRLWKIMSLLVAALSLNFRPKWLWRGSENIVIRVFISFQATFWGFAIRRPRPHRDDTHNNKSSKSPCFYQERERAGRRRRKKRNLKGRKQNNRFPRDSAGYNQTPDRELTIKQEMAISCLCFRASSLSLSLLVLTIFSYMECHQPDLIKLLRTTLQKKKAIRYFIICKRFFFIFLCPPVEIVECRIDWFNSNFFLESCYIVIGKAPVVLSLGVY